MVCHANGEGVYFGKTKHFRRIICVRGSFHHEMMKKFAVIVRMSAISIITIRVILSARVLITFGCEMMHYAYYTENCFLFAINDKKQTVSQKCLTIYIYIYIYIYIS